MILQDVLLAIYVFIGIFMFMFGAVGVFIMYRYPINKKEETARKWWARILIASPVWPFAIVVVLLYGIVKDIWHIAQIAMGKR